MTIINSLEVGQMSDFKDVELNNKLFAGFDRYGNQIGKNILFDKFFADIKTVEDLKNKEFYDIGKYSPGTFIMKSDINGIFYKFDVIQNEKYMFCIGDVLDSSLISSSVDARDKVQGKILSDKEINNSKRMYCTLILDCGYRVSFYSENVKDILRIDESPYGQRIDGILGEKFLEKVKEKIGYLDFVEDMSIEFEDKMVVISKAECGFLCVNIYPYTNAKNDKLEEVYSLYSKIDKLEKEMKQKDNLIQIQKSIISELSYEKTKNIGIDCMDIFDKMGTMLANIKQSCDNFSFIDVGIDDKKEYPLAMEQVIDSIKKQIDSENERLYKLGESNFGILLRYGCSEEFKNAVKKYSYLLSEMSKEHQMKFKIIKTDVKY